MSQKTTPYRKGYQVEHFCREKLREMGALVIRSSRSLGPADIIAIMPNRGEIWLIQVKQMDAPKNQEKLAEMFKDLKKLEGTYKVKPKAFMRVKGKYQFIDI
jgi:Holliday junction resolvase